MSVRPWVRPIHCLSCINIADYAYYFPYLYPPILPTHNVLIDMYQYTEDLLQLNAVGKTGCQLPSLMHDINTPLHVEAWQRCLEKHPDLNFVDYILSGITNGFRIGFSAMQPLSKSI